MKESRTRSNSEDIVSKQKLEVEPLEDFKSDTGSSGSLIHQYYSQMRSTANIDCETMIVPVKLNREAAHFKFTTKSETS